MELIVIVLLFIAVSIFLLIGIVVMVLAGFKLIKTILEGEE